MSSERIKPAYGDLWKVSKHKVYCGDVVGLFRENGLPAIPEVDVVYTDPPWNQGILKVFHNHAKKGGVEGLTADFAVFLCGFVDVLKAKCPRGALFIEMGVKHTGDLVGLLESKGARTAWIQGVYYDKPPRPNSLWAGTFADVSIPAMPPGLHGRQVINWVIDNGVPPGARFLDGCCGVGTFPLGALKRKGAEVYGCELIPKKVESFLLSLEKQTGVPAVLG